MRSFLFLSCALACLACPVEASPIIQYQATLLNNVGPGQNQYQFEYTVSGYTFLTNQDFVIHFSPSEFLSMSTGVASPMSDWDLLITQPDALLPSDGTFDALALVDNPSLAGPFRVNAVFLGAGTPGPQVFEIDQFDPAGHFQQQIAIGRTSLPASLGTPEPGCSILVSLGLASIFTKLLTRSK